jgi:hypothetical protein
MPARAPEGCCARTTCATIAVGLSTENDDKK